ncbi:MAG: DUF6421 family protein [Gammaproteobacteria bacterium]|nr:DUF6421 family protein [Gammaproteobacteria bacterium]
MSDIIKAIDRLRVEFMGANLQDSGTLKKIAEYLNADSILKNVPAVQAFVIDAIAFSNQPGRLTHVKEHINSETDHFVFSAFNAPYFKNLSLDAFYYKPLPVPDGLKQKLKSPVFPVNTLEATEGFHSKPVVALFPENHIDQIQLPEDVIFYFIDKFVSRFFRVTKPLLAIVNQDQLTAVRNASTEDIEQASIYWVCLHEYFHRQGHMPIPKFLPTKTLRPLAGLEELRVDLRSIFYCLDDGNFINNPRFVAEFILTERLLRYAVEGIPTPNYDAIASQVLFNYLTHHDAIQIDENHILTLSPTVYDALRMFYQEIDVIESQITETNEPEIKNKLLQFVHSNLKFDSDDDNYQHNRYFSWVKTKFGF